MTLNVWQIVLCVVLLLFGGRALPTCRGSFVKRFRKVKKIDAKKRLMLAVMLHLNKKALGIARCFFLMVTFYLPSSLLFKR